MSIRPNIPTAFLATFTALFIAFAGCCSIAKIHAEEFLLLRNIDLPGNDLRSPRQDASLKEISLERCQKVCLKETNCSAFSYDKRRRQCALKAQMSKPISTNDAISGVKASRQTAQSKRRTEPPKKAKKVSNPKRNVANGIHAETRHKTAISAMPAQRALGQSKTVSPRAGTAIPIPAPYRAAAADKPRTIELQQTPSQTKTTIAAIPEPPKSRQTLSSINMAPQTAAPATNNLTTGTTTPPANQWQFTSMEAVLSEQNPSAAKPVTAPPPTTTTIAPPTAVMLPSAPNVKRNITSEPFTLASQNQTPQIKIPAAAPPPPLPTPRAQKIARLTTAAPKKPLIDTNRDAGLLSRLLSKHSKLQEKARKLSERYFRKYDSETAGTKWIEVSSLGMKMPMALNRAQARAVILGKLRKDEKLPRLQKQMAKLDQKLQAPLKRVKKFLPKNLSQKLTRLYLKKRKAAAAFRTAKKNLRKFGGALADRVEQTWQMPSAKALKKLHHLAKNMRVKRAKTLKANEAFAANLKKAIKTPIPARTF